MAKKTENANEKVAAEKKVKNKDKNKKPNFFVRTWRKIKEVFSELKKVTWPSFGTVMKQLGCVLVIILILLVIIMFFDFGLSRLLALVRHDTASAAIDIIGRVL